MESAEAAVSFAVEKLGEALINKEAFLRGVEEQVNLLKEELKMTYPFLRDATQKQAPNNPIHEWTSQIRQVAHDAEDVIETFSLKIDIPRQSRGMLGRCACFPFHVNLLDELGKEIKSIRARLKNIVESRTHYGFEDHGEGSEYRRLQDIAHQQQLLVPQETDKDVVGLDRYMKSLLGETILNDRPGLLIACITGVEGVGKSTLAREVYNHAAVVARFKSRGWVVIVSKKFAIIKLLKQLGGSEDNMEKFSLIELKGKLREHLRGKQYFIVLDDVRSEVDWQVLKDAFLDEQDKRSRLLVTSRNNPIVPYNAWAPPESQPLDPDTINRIIPYLDRVPPESQPLERAWAPRGSHPDTSNRILPYRARAPRVSHPDTSNRIVPYQAPRGSHPDTSNPIAPSRAWVPPKGSQICATQLCELQPLETETSWQLFLKKSFIDDTKCPPELEDIGRQIVEKCGGLPLVITVVGGLCLNERQSRRGWEKILNGLDYYLSISENKVSAVLKLSYHESYRNLPPHLKSCFLCLGFFKKDDFHKEDATISAEKLVQVWIAEGLISQEGSEESMEEIASGYLDELINQNILQVKDMTKDDDRVEICQIHPLIRDFSINKAKKEIGFEILKEGQSSSSDRSRHHAIPYRIGGFNSNSLVCGDNKHIRSLFFHGAPYTVVYDYIYPLPSFNWNKFILLRVLDFEGFGLWYLPAEIGTLIGLRYLGLRDNYLVELPISLACLVNLQVLDIRENSGIKVPDIMWKLKSLRHLYMPMYPILDAPLRLDTLKNLRTLVCRNRGRWMRLKHIMEMTNLHKLDVWISEEEVSEFISSLAKLKKLVCLKLLWGSVSIPIFYVRPTLHRLRELELYGKLELPFHNIFPPNLSQLTLFRTEIDQDSMRVLEKLPKLVYLNLKCEAFVGKELVISDNGFPKLRVLCISHLVELKKIEFVREGREMSELKRLEIQNCPEIESLPEQLISVQELKIKDCPKLKIKDCPMN